MNSKRDNINLGNKSQDISYLVEELTERGTRHNGSPVNADKTLCLLLGGHCLYTYI